MLSVSFILIACSALLAGIIASPITSGMRRLLASVSIQEAAPATFVHCDQPLAHNQILPVISLQWQRIFQWTLMAALPVSTWWRLMQHAHSGLLQIPLLWIAVISLLTVALLDAATHLVLQEILYPSGVSFLLAGILTGHLPSQLIGAVAGGGIMAILYLAGKIIYGTDALGAGDIELGVWFGILLGWPGIFAGYIKAMLLLLIGLGILFSLRKISLTSYIPIGAFLCLGVLAQFLLGGNSIF